MWALYLIKANSNKRKKYDEFTSVIEAFHAGNELMKNKKYGRYRVEKVECIANEEKVFILWR